MMFGKEAMWGGNAMMRGGAAMSSPLMATAPGGGLMGPPGASPTMPPGSSMVGEKPPLCKYFVNGGCLRGDQCTYLHELPDERHLDVNGLGFIFNSNVHNAQKTVAPQQQQPATLAPPPNNAAVGLGMSSIGGGGGIGLGPSAGGPPARKPLKRIIPKYRPPEPFLEHNLPPALAIPFTTSQADVLQSLLLSVMDTPPALPLSQQQRM